MPQPGKQRSVDGRRCWEGEGGKASGNTSCAKQKKECSHVVYFFVHNVTLHFPSFPCSQGYGLFCVCDDTGNMCTATVGMIFTKSTGSQLNNGRASRVCDCLNQQNDSLNKTKRPKQTLSAYYRVPGACVRWTRHSSARTSRRARD
ncbi:unnamed protein product [Ectocarpus sp. 12 AP-2014]